MILRELRGAPYTTLATRTRSTARAHATEDCLRSCTSCRWRAIGRCIVSAAADEPRRRCHGRALACLDVERRPILAACSGRNEYRYADGDRRSGGVAAFILSMCHDPGQNRLLHVYRELIERLPLRDAAFEL